MDYMTDNELQEYENTLARKEQEASKIGKELRAMHKVLAAEYKRRAKQIAANAVKEGKAK